MEDATASCPSMPARTIARRLDDETSDALVVTAELRALPTSPGSRRRARLQAEQHYYFEFMVMEAYVHTRALSLGFLWGQPGQSLPVQVQDLDRAVFIGGELPRGMFNGTEVALPTGWRPALHCSE
eukprot:936437-Amphidinium_carterae.1